MSPGSNFDTKGAKLNRFENLESDFWERRKLNAKNSKPDAGLKWISASANVQQEPVNSKTGHEPVSVLEKEKGEEKVSKATQKSESEVKFVNQSTELDGLCQMKTTMLYIASENSVKSFTQVSS